MKPYSSVRAFILLTMLLIVSCKENNITEPEVDTRLHYLIKPSEYSTNHYFLDTFYFDLNTFYSQNYYTSKADDINNYFYVKEIEVWQSYRSYYNENVIRGNLIPDLNYLTKDEDYEEYLRGNSSVRSGSGRSTRIKGVFNERLFRLIEDEDYLVNRKTGLITLLQEAESFQDRNLAVAYKIEGLTNSDSDDLVMGDLNALENWDKNIDSLPIFKLIKPLEEDDGAYKNYNELEKLRPRNIYKVSDTKIVLNDFSLDLFFIDDNQKSLNSIEGASLLKQFGFDNNEDGVFDAIEGINIIPETGEIIFPKLQPFGKNIPDFFKNKYEINSIYEGSKEVARTDSNINRFYFAGRYNPE